MHPPGNFSGTVDGTTASDVYMKSEEHAGCTSGMKQAHSDWKQIKSSLSYAPMKLSHYFWHVIKEEEFKNCDGWTSDIKRTVRQISIWKCSIFNCNITFAHRGHTFQFPSGKYMLKWNSPFLTLIFFGSAFDFCLMFFGCCSLPVSHYCRGTKLLVAVNLYHCCRLMRNPLITSTLQLITHKSCFITATGMQLTGSSCNISTGCMQTPNFRFLSVFINAAHLQ